MVKAVTAQVGIVVTDRLNAVGPRFQHKRIIPCL